MQLEQALLEYLCHLLCYCTPLVTAVKDHLDPENLPSSSVIKCDKNSLKRVILSTALQIVLKHWHDEPVEHLA